MTQTIKERLRALVHPSRRKLTLFACSCVREIWHLLKDERSKDGIITTENYADGLISKEKMQKAAYAAYAAADDADDADDAYAVWAAAYAAADDADDASYDAAADAYAVWAAADAADASSNKEQVLAKQHQLFDDIFGS